MAQRTALKATCVPHEENSRMLGGHPRVFFVHRSLSGVRCCVGGRWTFGAARGLQLVSFVERLSDLDSALGVVAPTHNLIALT